MPKSILDNGMMSLPMSSIETHWPQHPHGICLFSTREHMNITFYSCLSPAVVWLGVICTKRSILHLCPLGVYRISLLIWMKTVPCLLFKYGIKCIKWQPQTTQTYKTDKIDQHVYCLQKSVSSSIRSLSVIWGSVKVVLTIIFSSREPATQFQDMAFFSQGQTVLSQ